jgi:hypothetical protein
MMVRGRVVILPAPNEDNPMTYKPEISPEEITNLKTFMLRHVGSNNRVSPERLAEYLYGKPTANNIRKARAARREINADDTNNMLIITDRDEGGFYLATREDAELVKRHIAEEDSIALAEWEKVRSMKRKAAQLLGIEFESHAGQGRLF